MIRFLAASPFALLFTFLSIGAATGPAVAAGPHYRAELAAAAADRVIVRGLVWRCAANGCTAGRSNSRAAIDCAGLARRAGAVRSFTVEGRAMSAAELEKCNARAR